MFCSCKKSLEKKSGTSQGKIFVPCTTKECNNITTPYYPFSTLFLINTVVAYRRLKTKQNFKLLALKVVMVAYERCSLSRGSKYSDLNRKKVVFWKTDR